MYSMQMLVLSTVRFLARAVVAIAIPSVHPSLTLVIHAYKRFKISKYGLHCKILGLLWIKFRGSPQTGVPYTLSVDSDNLRSDTSEMVDDRPTMLVLFTNGKSYMGFPLISKLVTLNDLERRSQLLSSIDNSGSIAHSVAMFASSVLFSIVVDLMAWLPSLSRDQK